MWLLEVSSEKAKHLCKTECSYLGARILFYDAISSQVNPKIRIIMPYSLIAEYCNHYLYWIWFGDREIWSTKGALCVMCILLVDRANKWLQHETLRQRASSDESSTPEFLVLWHAVLLTLLAHMRRWRALQHHVAFIRSLFYHGLLTR